MFTAWHEPRVHLRLDRPPYGGSLYHSCGERQMGQQLLFLEGGEVVLDVEMRSIDVTVEDGLLSSLDCLVDALMRALK